MIRFLRKLWSDRRGNVLVIAGASMPLVIGAAGLATDTIQWTLWKRQLQRAADSAAIAGVYSREASAGSTAPVPTSVANDLSLNLHTSMALKTGFPQLAYPGNTSSMSNQVTVTLAIQQPLTFSSFFMPTAPTITARATAASIASGTACVEALETNASATGITNSGNTTISMPQCIMHSNSPSANSASAGGSSDVTAKAISAVGGVAQSNNWHVQSYMPYSPPLVDPFEDVTPVPGDMHCTSAALSTSTNIAAMQAAGINCFSSMTVGSNRSLDLTAAHWTGPIYINGGSVDLRGSLSCNGCTIVLTNQSTSSTATIGTITSNAQANNNITAPTTGPFAGIAIYQDRRATGNTNKINGGSNNVITGAVYFPKDVLWINGSGTASALCAMIVARQIVFTGNSGIALKGLDDADCAGSGLPAVSSVKRVRLVA